MYDIVFDDKGAKVGAAIAPAHKSVLAIRKLRDLRYDLLGHLPILLILAPSDLHIFLHLTKLVAGKRFASNEDVKRAVDEYFSSLSDSHLRN